MSASIEYVDVARFDAVDRNEVVAAAFACPWCLGVPPWGRIQSATDESFIELSSPCDAAWTVVVDSGQLLRLVVAPPPDIVLTE
jgi:hypothetical protein